MASHKDRKLSRGLMLVLSVVFTALLLPIVIYQFFGQQENIFSGVGVGVRLALSAIVIAVIAVSTILMSGVKPVSRPVKKYLVAGLAILAIATQILVAHALMSQGHTWDVGTVDDIARYYARHDTTAIPNDWNSVYLAKYENNIPLTLMLSLLYKSLSPFFGNHYVLYAQIVNSTALLLTVLLLVIVARLLYGSRAALLAFIASYCLILLSPYTPITYTDTLGAFWVIATVLCAVMITRSKKASRLAWSGLFGLAITCSYLTKPTAIFIGLSIIGVFIVKCVLNNSPRKFLKIWGVTSMVCLLGAVGGMTGYKSILGFTPKFARYSEAEIDANKTPLQHFLAMGSLRGLKPYPECNIGAFCPRFVEYMQSGSPEVSTLDERKAYGIKLWQKSVEDDLPLGYTRLLVNKTTYNYSDGSFGAWQEGDSDKVAFKNGNSVDRAVRDYFGPFGSHRDGFKIFLHLVWLIILGAVAFGGALMFRNKEFRYDFWQNSFRSAVVAITLFLAIFESRPRYLFLYLPVFILLALGTLKYCSRQYKSATNPEK